MRPFAAPRSPASYLRTALHLGMRCVEEQPSSFDDAIEDLEKMQHLGRGVALHAFGELLDVRSSCHKFLFEVGAFTFLVHSHSCLLTVFVTYVK